MLFSVHRALLLFEREMVRDHRDELAVRRLALDVRHRIAEELLQHLDVAAVPGDLDRVADFRDFRPERGDALSAFLMQGRGSGESRFIGLFIGLCLPCLLGCLYDSTLRFLLSNFQAYQHKQNIHNFKKNSGQMRTFNCKNTNSDWRSLECRMVAGNRGSYFYSFTNCKQL